MMDSASCCHVDNFKKNNGAVVYKHIYGTYVSGAINNSRESKIKDVYCRTCETKSQRMQACGSCIFFGCVEGGHMKEHAKEKKHFISLDIMFGKVYCYECEDFMYDEELEHISEVCNIIASRKLGLVYNPPFHPTLADVKRIKENFNFVELSEKSFIGIRGLFNLGEICYMSGVLLALAHTPFLRDHYLSEKHQCQRISNDNLESDDDDTNSDEDSSSDEEANSDEDPNSIEEVNAGEDATSAENIFHAVDANSDGKMPHAENANSDDCMGCEVSKVIEELYSGDPRPVIIKSFVVTFIKNTLGFEFNVPADAYEFFKELICQLHEGDCNASSHNASKCTCIIGKVFKSVLQHDTLKISSICNARYENIEVDSNFSLILMPKEPSPSTNNSSPPINEAQNIAQGTPLPMDVDPIFTNVDTSHLDEPSEQITDPQNSLQGHIEGFMKFLPTKKKCEKCENDDCEETTHQRAFFIKLPGVFCFQINKTDSEKHVAFPEYLDMREYIPAEVKATDPFELTDFKYTLYAVVVNVGGDLGHYYSYIRQHFNRWFYCNNDSVKQSSFEEAAEDNAYMLFYFKDVVDHLGTSWMSKIRIPDH